MDRSRVSAELAIRVRGMVRECRRRRRSRAALIHNSGAGKVRAARWGVGATRAARYIDAPMPRVREQHRSWLRTRVCRGCGYGGPELQPLDETRAFECPCCGDDLYARPPMSYAEMEGLIVTARSVAHAIAIDPGCTAICTAASAGQGRSRLASRGWLARLLIRLRLMSA